MIKFNIITLFPDLFLPYLQVLPYKRAIDKQLIQINLVNLRDFAIDKRGTVDDRVYSGGVGMLLMIEPIYKALESIYGKDFEKTKDTKRNIILLSPRGEMYNQNRAKKYLDSEEITFICGRYEGIDARVEESLATEMISTGNYILSGGEIPALTIIESVTRLIPGVLEKEDAAKIESFENDKMEYPQYTRPETYRGMSVPEVLIKGNHKEIRNWKEKKQEPVKM